MLQWCRVCGCRHSSSSFCHGELEPTGVEFPGWKVNVETPRGILAIGVLLAEAGDRWRARILTHPNVLWTVPGGGGTMKFLGASSEQVEQQAIAYIREHCANRGYTMRDQVADLEPQAFRSAELDHAFQSRAPRFSRILPVRYGVGKPVLFGRTGDLSSTGMFVHTRMPMAEGVTAGLLLQLEHCRLPLRGNVIWTRKQAGPSRPVGMGVQLIRPPSTYRDYVQALAVEEREEPELALV
jgi:hypothetical protein